MSKPMNKEQIKDEVWKAQKEFTDVTASCIVFLNKNGLKIDFIKKLLHNTIDRVTDQITKKLDEEKK